MRSIGANVESQEPSDDAIQKGGPPLAGIDRPLNLPPTCATGDFGRDFRKTAPWPVAFWAGSTILALSLVWSCLAAPFLVPFFQLFLLPPFLIAAAIGSLGGLCRTWWLTGLMWSSLLVIYVWHDINTNPFGYKSLYSTYFLKQPPQGFMYFHSWWQLYQVTVIPLTLGVAVLTHEWVARRRQHEGTRGPILPDSEVFGTRGRVDTAIKTEPGVTDELHGPTL